jgi:hypothetical protein
VEFRLGRRFDGVVGVCEVFRGAHGGRSGTADTDWARRGVTETMSNLEDTAEEWNKEVRDHR